MLSQAPKKLTPFATSVSVIFWAGFSVAVVFWHLGITGSAFLPVALVTIPYAILLFVSKKEFGKRRPWFMMTLSILIGSYGAHQYCQFFIVRLSSLSNVALWQVPATQLAVLLGGFALAALWQVLIENRSVRGR